MTIEQLRTAYQAQPFQPFSIHVADGRKLSVSHRELLAISPTGRTFTLYDGVGVAHVLDLLLVRELEIPPGDKPPRRKRAG